jgi:hypothetical protein
MSSVVGKIESALDAEGRVLRMPEACKTGANQTRDFLSFRRFRFEFLDANQIV